MSSQFAVLKKGFGLAATLAYAIVFVGCLFFKFTDVESHVGVLITFALITLIPIAYIAYGSGIIADPAPPNPDGPTGSQLRARVMVAHFLLWAALIIFPLATAPALSGFLILLVLALIFVGLAYKTPKDNEKDTKSSLQSLEGWLKPAIAVVIALIFLFAGFYNLHISAHTDKALEISGHTEMAQAVKNGDILEMIALKYREVTNQRSQGNWEAEERRIRGASFNLIPRSNQQSQCDPLAGPQVISLNQGPPPMASAGTTTLPGFIASVNNWSRPVVLAPGYTNGIPLSPDSYINITTPEDAVFITFLTETTGAGSNIVLESGTCSQSGNEVLCIGQWHQGNARGDYRMSVQSTGATARLYANVDGDRIQVCQITIIIR